jgi:hypothetical protein
LKEVAEEADRRNTENTVLRQEHWVGGFEEQ